MGETACLTAYTNSKAMPSPAKVLSPFANGSSTMSHGYVNGSINTNTYSTINGGGGGARGSGGTANASNGNTSTTAATGNGYSSMINGGSGGGGGSSAATTAAICNGGSNGYNSVASSNGGSVATAAAATVATPCNGSTKPCSTPDHSFSAQGFHASPFYSHGSALATVNGVSNHHCQNGNGNLINAANGTSNNSSHNDGSHGDALGKSNGNSINAHVDQQQPDVRRPSLWYEEEIDENLRWCFGLTRILHTGVSKYQEIALLETEPFGKVLTLDRKMQSAEMDEWVYHECLVHPALLLHSSPKKVFIMGGGEGSTAREALRHRSVRKVVMCDIDQEVVNFCRSYLTMNKEAFQSSRLHLKIDDARAELESQTDHFDVIVGDLADPMEGGPCYQLYSRGFYEGVVKPKLNHGGIFVTQAGPAGILSHKEVFTSIFNTLRHVFNHVVAYTAHVPSYADTWGWVMASDQPFNQVSTDELDNRIKQRIKGELRYLDGATLHAATMLNKTVRQSLMNEKHVYTEDTARFVYGHGRSTTTH